MLYAAPPKSRFIETVKKGEQEVELRSQAGILRLIPMTDNCVRITYTTREAFSKREKPGVLLSPKGIECSVEESEDKIVIKLAGLHCSVCRKTGAISYYKPDGTLYFKERNKDPRELEEFQSYVLAGEEHTQVEKIQTVDGVKDMVREAGRIPGDKLFHTRFYPVFDQNEGIYGLGQQEEGILNLRGKTVYVHQANRKIAVPFLISTRAYGLLFDTYSPMIFNDTSVNTCIYTEADDELDYYFIGADTMDGVVSGYRQLTGKAAMLPKWAFGYMQSQERYETAEELLQISEKYRKENLGLDCIVLDWCSWEDGQWGQKSFDPKRFPDPTELMKKLHDMDVHFMISIWPNMAGGTANHEEMKKIDGFLKASDVYNALSGEARELYWKQVSEKLFCHGVDAWWCDSSEPLTVEWTHPNRVEPGLLFAMYCKELSDHMPAWATNAFPLYHAKTLYDGQRGETLEKRVCNLTRSAYTGQQRYGTILWSGDTAASWQTFREQVTTGLNFVSAGIPYWTTDIGAFFVKKSNFWYWDGDFDMTIQDAGYRELYARWFQWAAFLPIFRAHGTDCRREMWEFNCGGNSSLEGNFFEAMKQAGRVRYRLMPYLYSQAGRVWLEDASMMKPVVFDYPEDDETKNLEREYLFCESLLVCPVTEPMYYGPENEKLDIPRVQEVYLPEGNGWYDINDGSFYQGGQWVSVSADMERLPVFVKEGSILPIGKEATHVLMEDEVSWVVYAGRDCCYTYYQDAGDGYAYEKGEYSLESYTWSEKEQKLRNQKGETMQARVISPKNKAGLFED